eukprot:CAMPEP_0204843540 /NCGR_PEP_ID=MMETSP1346-20131115/48037_1 /ASSEMBLY_ACC=CAM_ASM_000771 /TAXON_ID=215587 /ORGANISM="Aplanochytrium stocchinoi, Strain GSBS06" /LENGTH=337 /DNA_ID=CAMNT_0051982697 /DNA_START=770 /DNA_END=1783 /DNA_ORIENTATION=+
MSLSSSFWNKQQRVMAPGEINSVFIVVQTVCSLLSMRCGEGENTPLHFVAFRYNDVDTIRLMISKYPAALLAVNRYGRTPVETAKTKFAFQKKGNASLDVHPMECWATRRSNHVAIVKFLEQATESYGAWRNQLCVHCCANRLFLTEGVEPCVSWMGTESFFALNVIGMCLQNGMKAVALNIISFVGTKIGVNGQKSEEKDIRDSIEEENKALYLAQLTDFLDQVENRSSSSGRHLYKKLRKVGVNQYAKYALLLKRQYNCIPCGWQALYVEGYRKEKLEISQLAFSRIRGSFLLSANVASHNSSDTDSGRWRSPSNSDSDTSDSDSAIDSAKETNI